MYFFLIAFFQKSWSDAKKFCVDHGMQLVTLKTREKMQKLNDSIPSTTVASKFFTSQNSILFVISAHFWVDASDVGQQPGHFVWADGTEVNTDRALWYRSYPFNFGAGKETFIVFWTGYGQFIDAIISRTLSFICELAKEDLISCI